MKTLSFSILNVFVSKRAFVTIRTPRFSSCFVTSLTMSASSAGKMDGPYSTTVTYTPKSHSIDAHSIPITPPPTISSDFGKLSNCNAWSEFSTYCPSIVNPAIPRGFEAVAMTTFVGTSISFSSPLDISTDIVPGIGEKIDGPKIRPVP